MDLFYKTEGEHNYTVAKAAGIYPYFHALTSGQNTVVEMEGKRTIMLGSNNYLGLTSNPEVVNAGIEGLKKYGSGCSGSRFLNGTLDILSLVPPGKNKMSSGDFVRGRKITETDGFE